MEKWQNLKEWSQKEKIKFSVKILEELGMNSEQIQEQLKLSKQEKLKLLNDKNK